MNTQETVFDVAGMSCGSCVRHIDQALAVLPGVQHVAVELAARLVRVSHDSSVAPVDALLTAIADAGYEAKARSPALASK